MQNIFFCKSCVVMSTRNRISFDKNGICTACQWNQEKKKVNWKRRRTLLSKICNQYKTNDSRFDCIVPVSGGKDGSYVSMMLKKKYNMTPLTVTIRPALEMDLGKKNLSNFINSGFSHLHVTTHPEGMRKLNLYGFEKFGFPYYGWLIAIHSVIIRVAISFNIKLIFYAEDGEVEYGGDAKLKNKPIYDTKYIISNYLENKYHRAIKNCKLNKEEKFWFEIPEKKILNKNKILLTHLSYFYKWDPYQNYIFAKKYCGLEEKKSRNEGSYTNFAQNDQKLYSLHCYLMYLKFGFGRANQDACIDIRRGALSREQAIQLVKMYDNQIPSHLFDEYCEYYKISKNKFFKILDKWANKKLFKKIGKFWYPQFKIF